MMIHCGHPCLMGKAERRKRNITKKTCYIKIVPTHCFPCEAHQGTQQLKKSNIIYVERNKISIRFVVPTKCKSALVGTALCITHAV